VRAAAGVGADQDPAAQPARQLRQRQPRRLDMAAAVLDQALSALGTMASGSPFPPAP
jgi:hypothetical protein